MTFQKVNVISFKDKKDDYGQRRKKIDQPSRETEMMIVDYIKTRTDDVRFVDITDLGLTYDRDIDDSNQIITASGTTYNVIYVIPSRRLNQVLLQKVK